MAVPDRLEKTVGEAGHKNVLDRLLAKEMVDTEDLVLLEILGDQGGEFFRAAKIAAEGLFDDDPVPTLGRLSLEHLAQLGNGRCEQIGLGRQVEQGILPRSAFAVERVQAGAQLGIGARLRRVQGKIVQPAHKGIPIGLIGSRGHMLGHQIPVGIVAVFGSAHSQNRELLR